MYQKEQEHFVSYELCIGFSEHKQKEGHTTTYFVNSKKERQCVTHECMHVCTNGFRLKINAFRLPQETPCDKTVLVTTLKSKLVDNDYFRTLNSCVVIVQPISLGSKVFFVSYKW